MCCNPLLPPNRHQFYIPSAPSATTALRLTATTAHRVADQTTENKLAAYTTRAQQPTSLGTPTLWVYTSLGRPVPLPHPSYQD